MLAVDINTKTNGKGFWSNSEKNVNIYKLASDYMDDSKSFMSVDAYFSNIDWDIEKDGLIYTDELWMITFRDGLVKNGFSKEATNDIFYSEQGLQGDNYVNLDAGKSFIKEWIEKTK